MSGSPSGSGPEGIVARAWQEMLEKEEPLVRLYILPQPGEGFLRELGKNDAHPGQHEAQRARTGSLRQAGGRWPGYRSAAR